MVRMDADDDDATSLIDSLLASAWQCSALPRSACDCLLLF